MDIKYTNPKTILTPTGGYLEGYSHSLNPYTGCAFGCSYCYVRKLPVALFRKQEWGSWVDIKSEAAVILKKELQKYKKKAPVQIFMSSATDPYQPVEQKTGLTRELLKVMLEHPPDFLFVQTRSPLVTRDLDLFLSFQNIRISISIETDLEETRKKITPFAPPIKARLKAIETLAQAGIDVQATVSPILPHSDQFASTLASLVQRVGVDDFFYGDGSSGKRTESLGIRSLFQSEGWESWYNEQAAKNFIDRLRIEKPDLLIKWNKAAFLPGC